MPDNSVLLIAVGAALGANARYLVSVWAARRYGTGFPFGTLIANLSGSLMLGFLAVAMVGMTFGHEVALLVSTGLLGAYTTFSTFAFESFGLIRRRAYGLAAANVFGSVLVGLVAAWAGMTVARWM